MELIETLAKLFGLLLFYTFFVLVGGTFLCFMLLVAVAYAISGLFGIKKSGKVDLLESQIREDNIYAHDTIVLYKKEEYQATIMYDVQKWTNHLEFDILSITSPTEDFTDILPPEEIARLIVELEYSHVD